MHARSGPAHSPLIWKKRLDSTYFKILRLLCRDFRGKVSRDTLLRKSGMMSLRSLFIARDIKLLHKLCTELRPEPLIERLMSQSYVQSRRDHRLYFYDYSARKVGRASFINRAKYTSELIPFEWLNLNTPSFHRKLYSVLPLSLKL